MIHSLLRRWCAWCVAAAALGAASPVMANEVEAYSGAPYGVGRVLVNLSGPDAEQLAELHALEATARGANIYYPAFVRPPIRRLVEGVFGDAIGLGPGRIELFFLFDGDAPFELTLYTPSPRTLLVSPQRRPAGHQRLFRQWWQNHNNASRDRRTKGDYPPVVENYLAVTLARRFGLPLPEGIGDTSSDRASRQAMHILTGSENIREAVMIETLLGRDDRGQAADQPLPSPIDWAAVEFTPPAEEVEIEPIAERVPEECFYVRFGNVPNFLWVRRLLDEYSGDLARMVTLQGRNDELNQRIERQLGLRYTVLLDLAGEHVIRDMALIGQDAFFREGPAIGMLFHARNPTVLSFTLQNELSAAMNRFKDAGAKRETVEIAGRKVAFYSTPDNRLRSFYAVDGDYFLATSSRRLVERFFEAGEGKGALGGSDEFRQARTLRPLGGEDTVFVYISTRFLQSLLSPQTQIELRRRLQATTDIELYEVARLMAEAEGLANPTLEELVRNNLLPPRFTERPDGSRLVIDDGQVTDSLRGGRGSFVPIPDIELQGATEAERARYGELAQYHASDWRRMEPLLVAIKREALDEAGLERVTLDARVSPFSESQYGGLGTLLAGPATHAVTPSPDDILHVQAHVKGGLIMPGVPTHLLFVGVQDAPPMLSGATGGLLEVLRILRATPGYLGSVPRPGFLDRLPIVGAPPPDAYGYSPMALGLWRRVWGDFAALSFDRFVLDTLPRNVRLEPTEDPAQVRWRVGDLANSRIGPWVDRLAWQRVRGASLGNAQLLHLISQQFRLPRDQAREQAERLLDTKLVDALGGDYSLVQRPDGLAYWASDRSGFSVGDYRTPLLEWFRGAEGSLSREQSQLVLHGYVLMQRKKTPGRPELPFLDFFGIERKKRDEPAQPEK